MLKRIIIVIAAASIAMLTAQAVFDWPTGYPIFNFFQPLPENWDK